jgi:predicted metal-dependent hydrolase
MNTINAVITILDIPVEVIRKDIKNLHLAVYPPYGSVRVSVPRHITDENVRLAVISRLPWIKKQQVRYQAQARQSMREYITGESHYYSGNRYLLEVVERYSRHDLAFKNKAKIVLYVRPGTTIKNRELVVNNWYRQKLKESITTLLDKWKPIIKKDVHSWGIKKMKTKWGSCNISEKRIWLNLELAKKPPECLEYILVHELVHLHERLHNDNFRCLMDKFLPNWRMSRDILKKEPLAYENWNC